MISAKSGGSSHWCCLKGQHLSHTVLVSYEHDSFEVHHVKVWCGLDTELAAQPNNRMARGQDGRGDQQEPEQEGGEGGFADPDIQSQVDVVGSPEGPEEADGQPHNDNAQEDTEEVAEEDAAFYPAELWDLLEAVSESSSSGSSSGSGTSSQRSSSSSSSSSDSSSDSDVLVERHPVVVEARGQEAEPLAGDEHAEVSSQFSSPPQTKTLV